MRTKLRRSPQRAEPTPAADPTGPSVGAAGARPHNVLLITVDQQRFDALGVHGGQVARTPHLDTLAAEGIDYTRCNVQSVVCMPSRSTILSGQHPYTHGVRANGVALPPDALSVAEVLRRAGYRTALVGKAHLEPHTSTRSSASVRTTWRRWAGRNRGRPAHWLGWRRGTFTNPEGGPTTVVPAALTDDQIREMTAMIAVENELIDDAVGRVLAGLGRLGLTDHTDVVFTSDHGDLGGDYGLVFKGPYHVDALMRVSLLWRPAAREGIVAAVVPEPVGLVDLAPTICSIAGVDIPEAMQGEPLPTAPGSGRERVLTTWDSQFAKVGMHLQSIHRDGLTATRYGATAPGGGGRFRWQWPIWSRGCQVPTYDGHEGELYDLADDPFQRVNRWDDPAYRDRRSDLLADLDDHLPPERLPLIRASGPA